MLFTLHAVQNENENGNICLSVQLQLQPNQMKAGVVVSFPFSLVPPSTTAASTLAINTNSFSLSNSNAHSNSNSTSTTPFHTPRQADALHALKTAAHFQSALLRVEGVLQVHDFNTILHFFGESKRWTHLCQLFTWMQENKRLNVASYRIYLKYLGLRRSPVKALKVYNSLQDVQIKLNVSVCNSLLGCLVRNGQMESALKLFQQMKCDEFSPNLITYSTLTVKPAC